MHVTEFRFKLYPIDFDTSHAFYSKTLGFPVVHEWNSSPTDRGVMFNTGTAIIELLSPHGDYTQPSGCALSLEVDDVHALWDQLHHQCTIQFALRHNEWGDTSFAITDPQGLSITFFTKD